MPIMSFAQWDLRAKHGAQIACITYQSPSIVGNFAAGEIAKAIADGYYVENFSTYAAVYR